MHIASRFILFAAGCLAGHAGAAVTVYTDRASYEAATTAGGIDRYTDLLPDSAGLPGPLTRSAGAHGYTVGAVDTANLGPGQGADYLFVLADAGGAPWLSTNFASAYLAFSGFGPAAQAVGGVFFSTDFAGQVTQSGLRFTVTDAGGSFSYAVANGSPSGFLGFASDSAISAFTVASAQGDADQFVTVGELAISAVPEPGAAMLYAAGLLALACRVRIRRRRG